MDKNHPVIIVKNLAKQQSIKISEKAIAKTADAHNFLTDFADFFLFLSQTCKELFSRNFEFREFLHQSFQIGYKSVPLISVTGFIMGLVLTIQARPSLVHFGAVSLLTGNGGCITYQGDGPGYNGFDLRRENRFRNGCRIRLNESDRTD